MAKFQQIESAVVSLDAQVKILMGDLQKLITTVNSNSKSQVNLASKTKAVETATKSITAVEKQRITIQNQIKSTFAKSLTLQEKGTRTLLKGKIRLKEEQRLLNQELTKELGISKKRSGLFRGMVKSLATVAAGYLGIQTAIRGLSNSIKLISAFQKSMDEVRAISNANNNEFAALRDNALELGAVTSKTAVQVSGLQKEFAKLGFSTKEILAATEATIDLSIAAGSDLADSAVVAASTVRGFGLAAQDTQRVVDVMAKAFSSSALDLNKFKLAMSTVAPVAKASGKDIEFVTSQLGVLADAGLDASTSGTSLRNMFLELNKQGLTWEEGLEKINTSTNKNVTALNLFGKRGATAALILADNAEKAELLEAKLDNAAGTAKNMADIMENNLAGDVEKAKSAFQGLVLNIGKNADGLRGLTQGVTRFVTNINKSLSPLKKQVNLYQLHDKKLTTLFTSLKNTNLSQEARNKLIKEANDKYGEYLPNLLTEKSTLEDIEKAETAINKQLRLKVIQQAFQEQINDLLKAELSAKEQIVNAEILAEQSSQRNLESTTEVGAIRAEQGKFAAALITDLAQHTIDNNDKEVQSTEEKFKRIGELYGIAFAEIEAILNQQTEVVEEQNEMVSGSEQKKYDKLLKLTERLIAERKALADSLVDEEIARNDEELERLAEQVDKEYELNKKAAEKEIKLAQEVAAEYEKLRQKKLDNIATGLDFASSAAQELFSLQQSLADSEIANVERQRDAEIAAAEKSGQDTSEIEAKYAKKEAALRNAQAKKEKQQALFSAGINIASGIVKALASSPPPANFILAALVGALGAVQLGVIAAKPIPKFKHGTGGMLQLDTTAIVGDGGKQELITTPTGNFLSPATDTMVHLPRGSQVFGGDSPETKAAMSGGMSDEHYRGLVKEERLTRKAIENIQYPPYFTEKSLVKLNKVKNSRIHYIDKYLKG